MLYSLQQFEGKDSVSFEKKINRSLIVLTLVYSITLGIILFISGSITYTAFSSRIGARFERVGVPGTPVQIEVRRGPTVEEVRQDLVSVIVLVDGLLLIIAVGASYLLARLTLQPLKDAYEEQRRFIADASHELRTPLAILHMELENELDDPAASVSAKEKARSHLEEVNSMTTMVQDLLLLSKFEGDEKAIESKPIDIGESIRHVVTQLQPIANERNVSLVMDQVDAVSISGTDAITHALTNIIKNAIVYNKSEGTVAISAEQKGSDVVVTVKDSGIGIATKDLAHIFDRFYRVDKSRSRNTGGSGLGLSIAERAVHSMGGTLHIESEVNTGTTVTLSLRKA